MTNRTNTDHDLLRWVRLEIRFWKNVKKHGSRTCWLWIGTTMSKKSGSYGQIYYNGAMRLAHRISWLIHFNRIPDDMCVLHKCDNPICVNPLHLFLGTLYDNNRDMAIKGRAKGTKMGETNPNSKLCWSQVERIRNYALQGYTHRQIGQRFNISHAQVGRIVRGEYWSVPARKAVENG